MKDVTLPVFLIILLCFFMCGTKLIDQNDNSFLDQFTQRKEFQNWINFWADSFSDVELSTLKFEHKNSLILIGNQLNSESTEKLSSRRFTLNNNKTGKFSVDLYPDVSFINLSKDGSLLVKGRDADPAFKIYNFNNAFEYYYTSGPTAFYDESIWTSDTSFAIFGVSFWPGQDSFQNFMVLKGITNRDTVEIEVYLSEKLPWKSGWTDYMSYKYPNIKFWFQK